MKTMNVYRNDFLGPLHYFLGNNQFLSIHNLDKT